MERMVSRMLAPLGRKLGNMLARGVVSGVQPGGKQQHLQVRLLSKETRDRLEHFEPFGLTAHPMPGAEHFTAFLDGDRSHGVVLVVNDRRYRVAGLPAGGVALYDAHGSSVVLHADGKATVTADKVTFTGDVEITGDMKARNVTAVQAVKDANGAHSMQGMRAAHDTHTGHNFPGATPDVRAG